MSSPFLPGFDDLYESHGPDADSASEPEPSTPVFQKAPKSFSSGSPKSLRRTPRLRQADLLPQPVPISSWSTRAGYQPGQRDRSVSPPRPSVPLSGLPSNYGELVTPQLFRRLVSQPSLRPAPNTYISRRAHDAILFALEAIRTGDGRNYKELSRDFEEESDRMSDLLTGDQPGLSGNSRPQNGASRAARGAPVPAGGVRTPTEVMRARRERDARRKAQEEEEAARLRSLEQEQLTRPQDPGVVPGGGTAGTGAGAGAGERAAADSPVRRRSSRRSGPESQDVGRRTSGAQFPSRRQENLPPGASALPRSRATTLDQGQPRPVVQQPRVSSRYEPAPAEEAAAAAHSATAAPAPLGPSRNNRFNPPLPGNVDEPVNQRAQPQAAPQAQPQPQPSAQPQPVRSGFPNAFERWETLSSHWEGLTSYWIRRLQENSNELDREPLNQQMSRQIVDLSAAGSNLFLAVFELQRLRASSERKFQRWFFETRSELERYQSQQTELERLLRVEREERARVVSSTGTADAEKLKAEEVVKEMRRELQISKEEARRAWEELGRREQEERDRTVSLRSGEPTLVGGVQVVPMTQGVPSRQTTGAGRVGLNCARDPSLVLQLGLPWVVTVKRLHRQAIPLSNRPTRRRDSFPTKHPHPHPQPTLIPFPKKQPVQPVGSSQSRPAQHLQNWSSINAPVSR